MMKLLISCYDVFGFHEENFAGNTIESSFSFFTYDVIFIVLLLLYLHIHILLNRDYSIAITISSTL